MCFDEVLQTAGRSFSAPVIHRQPFQCLQSFSIHACEQAILPCKRHLVPIRHHGMPNAQRIARIPCRHAVLLHDLLDAAYLLDDFFRIVVTPRRHQEQNIIQPRIVWLLRADSLDVLLEQFIRQRLQPFLSITAVPSRDVIIP